MRTAPKPTEQYTKALDKLAAMLREEARTVRQLARDLRCSKPTVYARLKALQDRGDQVFTFRVDESKTGPRPLAYGIAK